MLGKKKCPWRNQCRNGGEGCYAREPWNCVRFMPIEGTNLTEVDVIVETPPNIDDDKFAQYFTNWIESMGWSFCGTLKKYKEEKDIPAPVKKYNPVQKAYDLMVGFVHENKTTDLEEVIGYLGEALADHPED